MSLNSMQGIVVGGQSSVTDLAVQGNGYFVVSDAAGDTFLTRDGSFVPDAQGNLVNSDGYYLMGYNVQDGPAVITANSLNGTQIVNIDKAGEQATASTSGAFTANLPSTSANGQTETTAMVAYDNLGNAQNFTLKWTNASTAGSPNTWQLTVTDSTGAQTTATLKFDPNTGKLSSLTGASANGNSLGIQVPNGKTLSLDLS